MDRDRLIAQLKATFLDELDTHTATLEGEVLALERGEAADAGSLNERLQRLFRAAHSLKGAARAVSLGPIELACHRLEGLLAVVRDGRHAVDGALIERLLGAVDALRDAGARLRSGQPLDEAKLDAVAAAPPPEAGALAPTLEAAPPARQPPEPPSRVRIATSKLEALIDASGELSMAHRRLDARHEELQGLQAALHRLASEWSMSQPALAHHRRDDASPFTARRTASLHGLLKTTPARLRLLSKELDRLAANLLSDRRAIEQTARPLLDGVRRARLIPFAEACQGLDRAARDLAHAEGKQVELAVRGGTVEIDRAILDGLRDPLLHLLRNAVAHGIELPGERVRVGKPVLGRVTLSAVLRGDSVEVTLADDGRGVDEARVREQARRQGLREPRNDRELYELLFQPAFSTAGVVTDVSGRGVGLDAVRTSVEAMRGSIDLSSTAGQGARFTLRLPLTLALLRALLARSGEQIFAFPSSRVLRLVRARHQALRIIDGRLVLLIDETPVAVATLSSLLGLDGATRTRPTDHVNAVLLDAGDQPAAVLVDELLAERELAIKPLGPRLERLRFVGGATVLSSGAIALLLNVPDLTDALHALVPLSAGDRAAAPGATEPHRRKRLLIADDSLTTRALEKSILEAAGYEVTLALDGEEAWHLLQQQGADLLVSDVDMPRLDGIALTEAVRASQRFRDLPVVLVTGLSTDAERARGMMAGANAYLVKSAFDQTRLIETIARLL